MEEMYSVVNKNTTLMSLMCSVTLDLTDVVEDLSPAWANNFYDSLVLFLLSPGSFPGEILPVYSHLENRLPSLRLSIFRI